MDIVYMSSGIKWALSSCTNILCVYSVLVYSGFQILCELLSVYVHCFLHCSLQSQLSSPAFSGITHVLNCLYDGPCRRACTVREKTPQTLENSVGLVVLFKQQAKRFIYVFINTMQLRIKALKPAPQNQSSTIFHSFLKSFIHRAHKLCSIVCDNALLVLQLFCKWITSSQSWLVILRGSCKQTLCHSATQWI